MQCTVINMTIDDIKDTAFGHGFAFGKYTEQIVIDDKLKEVLDTNQDAIKAYMASYNEGFNLGFADTLRYERFDDVEIK